MNSEWLFVKHKSNKIIRKAGELWAFQLDRIIEPLLPDTTSGSFYNTLVATPLFFTDYRIVTILQDLMEDGKCLDICIMIMD